MDFPQWAGPSDRLVTRLVFWQRLPLVGSLIRQVLKLMGTDIPPETLDDAKGLMLPHCAKVTLHYRTRISHDVMIMQNVSIADADLWKDGDEAPDVIEIGHHALLGAGAAVLCKRGQSLTIAPWTVLGANSVLLTSTGPGEIWAGNPARLIRKRDDVSVETSAG